MAKPNLPQFEEKDLIFNAEQTKQLLDFFTDGQGPSLEDCNSPEARNLAQGMLVESINRNRDRFPLFTLGSLERATLPEGIKPHIQGMANTDQIKAFEDAISERNRTRDFQASARNSFWGTLKQLGTDVIKVIDDSFNKHIDNLFAGGFVGFIKDVGVGVVKAGINAVKNFFNWIRGKDKENAPEIENTPKLENLRVRESDRRAIGREYQEQIRALSNPEKAQQQDNAKTVEQQQTPEKTVDTPTPEKTVNAPAQSTDQPFIETGKLSPAEQQQVREQMPEYVLQLRGDVQNIRIAIQPLHQTMCAHGASTGAADAVSATITLEMVRNGMNANDIGTMGINIRTNSALVIGIDQNKFVSVAAVDASRNNPQQTLEMANNVAAEREQQQAIQQTNNMAVEQTRQSQGMSM